MRQKRIALIFSMSVINIMLCTQPAYPEIYKWVDNNGKTHFTDRPPADKNTEEITVHVNSYQSVEIRPLSERLGRGGKVVMYSTQRCGICKQAKRYFKRKSIPHVIREIDRNRIARQEYEKLGGKYVPFIIIGNQTMTGFTPERFEKIWQQHLASLQKKTNSEDTSK